MKTFLRGPRVVARYFVYALALSFTLLGSAACGGDDDDTAANAAQGSATGGAVTEDDIISLMCRPVKWVRTDASEEGNPSKVGNYWVTFRIDGTLVDGFYKDGTYSTNTEYNTWSLNLNTKELTIVYNADASNPDKIDVDRYTLKSVTANVAVLIDDYGDEHTFVAR